MTWGMVAGAAITVVGGAIASNQANKGAKSAANAQRDAQMAAIEEQRAARDQARTDLMPYQQWGQEGIPLLQKLNSGDYSGFMGSPDYQAALQGGLNAIDHRAAARGGLFGGGNTRDAMQYSSGLASQYLGNYRNSLFNQIGSGQNAAAGMGGFSTNAANQIGNAQNNIGNARASAYSQIGNNNAEFAAGTAGSLSGLAGQYFAQRSPSYPTNGGMAPGAGSATGNYNWASNSGFGNNYGWTS